MRKTALCLLAVGMLAGCATNPPVPPVPAVDPSSPLAAPTYMQMAASGDQFEIQSSQLAQQMSTNPAIRQFAQMLIAHHTQLSAQMMSTAQSAGLQPPPPALLPHHAQILQQLQSAPPGTFDVAFRDAQIAAHQEAVQLHQNYASGGDNAALRQVAATAVPIVQQHLTQAQSLPATVVQQPMQTQPTPVYEAPARPGERG